jgi:hypothetical protein
MPGLELFVQRDRQASPRRRPRRGRAHQPAADDSYVDSLGHPCLRL